MATPLTKKCMMPLKLISTKEIVSLSIQQRFAEEKVQEDVPNCKRRQHKFE